MKFLKRIIFRNRINKLKAEIEFVEPIFLYTIQYKSWFDLNWRLIRKYRSFKERSLLNGRDYEGDIPVDMSETERNFCLMILNSILKFCNEIGNYIHQYASSVDVSFFVGHIDAVRMYSTGLESKFMDNKVTLTQIANFTNMVFFYDDLLIRVESYLYLKNRLEELCGKYGPCKT